MALIVENGTGVVNAESLANVAFFRSYHADRGNDSAAEPTDLVVEQLLRKATDYIVGKYSGSWAGVQVLLTQSLPFPRIVNGVNIGLPLFIQQGVVELALIAKTSALLPSVNRGKKRVKIGPLEVEYDGNNPTATKFVAASMRFAPYLSGFASNSSMIKLIRT